MVEVIALHKSYGNKKILTNINLHFEPGKIHGIVGSNGAGKSTLFKCIAHLETFSGTIRYPNPPLKSVTGFMETNPLFMTLITGKEYLQLMCQARKIQVSDWEEKNVFDLPLGQYASTYSTGMKKKLALTAILLQKNEVFILDEPFNGVDLHSNLVMREVLLRLKALGKAIILSSHIFSTLSEVCDHMHHLEGGEVITSAERGGFAAIEEAMLDGGIAEQLGRLGL